MCTVNSSSGGSAQDPNGRHNPRLPDARGQRLGPGRAASVVVLFECLEARSEAIQYAVELSARIGSALVLLVLLRLEAAGVRRAHGAEGVEESVAEAFAPHLRRARNLGVPVEALLRVGDPYSELTKYLAETRTVHTIVWAGDRAALIQKPRKEQLHWLARIRDTVDIPVVIPSLRP